MPGLVRFLKRPVVVIAAVTLLGGWFRFSTLSFPPDRVFDEVYYSKDACLYLSIPYRDCGLMAASEQSWVHPPLGKWMIAAGEATFGNRPFGWRVSSAVVGTATVALTALLALYLTGSTLWAGVAGLLLATESLSVVQSRTSMLDIFEAFWVVVGFLAVVLDRRWIERRTPTPGNEVALQPQPVAAGVPDDASPGPGAMWEGEVVGGPAPADDEDVPPADGFAVPSPLLRPWRLAAGLAFGAGIATKWSAAFALVGAIVLSSWWELTRRRRAFRRHWFREALFQESFGILLFMVVGAALPYVASYAVFLKQNDWSFGQLLRHTGDMWHYHASLSPTKPNGQPIHPYLSPAWRWPFMTRPVAYYYKGTNTTAAEILGIGNPAVFWGSVIAVPYVAYRGVVRRDWAASFIAVGVLAQYVPWLFVSRPEFLFYIVPVVPFMVLAETYALRELARVRLSTGARPFAPVAGLLVAISVGLFVFFLPVLTGKTISMSAWHLRIWFRSWV